MMQNADRDSDRRRYYSDGKFGFSVQRKIWIGQKRQWAKFFKAIDWTTGENGNYRKWPEEFIWKKEAARGHMPLTSVGGPTIRALVRSNLRLARGENTHFLSDANDEAYELRLYCGVNRRPCKFLNSIHATARVYSSNPASKLTHLFSKLFTHRCVR